MGKKKVTQVTPQSTEKRGDREVIYHESDFKYLASSGWKEAKFKAIFADDLLGCYGFGNTKDSARAMLYDYAGDHGAVTN